MSKSIQLLPPDSNSCAVIILTCTGGNIAAKTHRRASDGSLFTEGFNAGKYFEYEEAPFDDLHGLHKIITEAAADSKKFMIRGRLRTDAPQRGDGRVRRCNSKQSDGEEPYFEDADRAWVMIDFDKHENPNGLPPTSVEAMKYLRTRLPPEFHDVKCIYSLSASAGLTESNKISGHLWFVFDRPVSNKELKSWLSGYPVDKALFNPVQAHYVASPVFRNGRVDPITERNGLLPGHSDVVSVPEINTSKPAYEYRGDGRGLEMARGYEAKMALLGDGDGLEGCHAVITSAIASYLTRHGPQADREALKADIRRRAAAAPWDRAAHSEEYVAHEVSDEVLDRSIQDWVDKIFIHSDGYQPSELDDVDVARKKLKRVVSQFSSSAVAWQGRHDERQALIKDGYGFFKVDKRYVYGLLDPPPRSCIAAQVGLGKTEAYISRVPQLVAALRPGHCVLITISNHHLSWELQRRLREEGVEAEVYLGPLQDDPDTPDKTMCWIPEDLQIFQKVGDGNKLCAVCPYRQQCGYQKQRSKKSSVWIGAHQILYRRRRAPISTVDFVIVDEDPLSAGIEGENLKQARLLSGDEVPEEVKKAIEGLPLGKPFRRVDFVIPDIELHKLAQRASAQIQKVVISEAASEQQLKEAFETAHRNLRRMNEAEFCLAILDFGPWGMRAHRTKDGVAFLRWVRQRKIHSDFDVPTLFCDATLHEDALERVINIERPTIEDNGTWIDEDGSVVNTLHECWWTPIIFGSVKSIVARTPHARFRQVLFSGAASLFNDDNSGENNVGRIRRYIEARSMGFGRVLVVCQLTLEKRLLELGLPPNVETAHFNAIRGQDKWKDVGLLIIIGRTQPSPAAIELQAEAVFQKTIKTLGPDYYDSAWMPLAGTDEEVAAERHPDAYAEILRWQVCEAEIIQAIGRGRGVNRTADNPLQVDLINKVPLPDIEIDEVVEWDDAQPDPAEVIAGRHGLVLFDGATKGTADAVAALLPDLFGSVNAAKQAKVYSRAETPNKEYYIGVSAREYTSGAGTDAATPIAVKARGCRFAVLAAALRPPIRRPLEKGEEPPKDADVNDDGVLAYGSLYVLKKLPRRLKAKML